MTASRSRRTTSSSRFEAFKKHSPQLSAYYRHVVKAEKTGERDITFTFDGPGNRELPQIVGQLNVLPKHWWEGTDASGKKRDVSVTTLEKPLGCGAYRIKDFVPGRSIVYERVPDYWGAKLNVNIGRDNFDELRYEYFRDSTVALEAFKADQIDWRTENSAKNWATAYDFPAVKDKRVLLEEFEIRSSGGMQAFAFNIRRDKFKDARVRRAFNFAFDFEEMNKQIFFGQYKRIKSYFEGLELASSGLPEGQELAILETVRGKVPAEVFTTPTPIRSAAVPENTRNNLREAIRLMKEAGYEIRDRKLVNVKTNEPLTVEFLASDPNSERFFSVLQALARAARRRRHGPHRRRRAIRESPAAMGFRRHHRVVGRNRSRPATSSAASGARRPPISRARAIYVGIKNEAVDAMIERVIFAKSREELVAATKALDRVLLWHHYVVPQWTYGKVRYRALGPFWPSRSAAEIRRCRHFRRCGGGTRTRPRRPERVREKNHAPQCAEDRRRRGGRNCDCARFAAEHRRRARRGAPRHFRLRRPEISRRLPAFRLCQSESAEGRDRSRRSVRRGNSTSLSSPSIRSTATS